MSDLEEEIEEYHKEIRRLQLEIERLQQDIQEENLLKIVSQTDLIHLQDQVEEQNEHRLSSEELFSSTSLHSRSTRSRTDSIEGFHRLSKRISSIVRRIDKDIVPEAGRRESVRSPVSSRFE